MMKLSITYVASLAALFYAVSAAPISQSDEVHDLAARGLTGNQGHFAPRPAPGPRILPNRGGVYRRELDMQTDEIYDLAARGLTGSQGHFAPRPSPGPRILPNRGGVYRREPEPEPEPFGTHMGHIGHFAHFAHHWHHHASAGSPPPSAMDPSQAQAPPLSRREPEPEPEPEPFGHMIRRVGHFMRHPSHGFHRSAQAGPPPQGAMDPNQAQAPPLSRREPEPEPEPATVTAHHHHHLHLPGHISAHATIQVTGSVGTPGSAPPAPALARREPEPEPEPEKTGRMHRRRHHHRHAKGSGGADASGAGQAPAMGGASPAAAAPGDPSQAQAPPVARRELDFDWLD